MRKIRHANPGKCHVCGADATWKTRHVIGNDRKSCDEHKQETEAWEKLNKRPPDDGYMSEGDYQSWGRL